jgi:NurA-like 5'-3' nuclease
MRLASAESNYHHVASAVPSLSNPKGLKNLQWEEPYHQLEMLLRKLDQADQEDYLQSKPFYVKEVTLRWFILLVLQF